MNFNLARLIIFAILFFAFNNCSRVGFINLAEDSDSHSKQNYDIQTVTVSAPILAVDILLVIDNSPSMAAELAKLSSRFSKFSESLAGIVPPAAGRSAVRVYPRQRWRVRPVPP